MLRFEISAGKISIVITIVTRKVNLRMYIEG